MIIGGIKHDYQGEFDGLNRAFGKGVASQTTEPSLKISGTFKDG